MSVRDAIGTLNLGGNFLQLRKMFRGRRAHFAWNRRLREQHACSTTLSPLRMYSTEVGDFYWTTIKCCRAVLVAEGSKTWQIMNEEGRKSSVGVDLACAHSIMYVRKSASS